MKTQSRKPRRTTSNPLPTPSRPSPPLLTPERLEKILAAAMSRGADFAEVYVERATSTAVSL
ncbi:MAG TPA: metalloprotease TldD, partial [Myxococcaceae bacterium]|nr:metalloprotease TldD [Myxococcaceae bacterium]